MPMNINYSPDIALQWYMASVDPVRVLVLQNVLRTASTGKLFLHARQVVRCIGGGPADYKPA